ncbi:hypothetical protein CY35_02G167800 [Sphagnum magellanicum]|nr:hypothetical protein CY35_02G167800 [Sphagnum magellanicum]
MDVGLKLQGMTMQSCLLPCSSFFQKPGHLSFSSRLDRNPPRRLPGIAIAAAVPIAPEYGYVVLTAVSSAILTQWQSIQMYEDAEVSVFNCYQRAHQNTLESYPAFLSLLIVGGFGYPITASVCGAVWVLGRVVYSLGYYTGDPTNRFKGMWNIFGLLGLLITCLTFGVRQVLPLYLSSSV